MPRLPSESGYLHRVQLTDAWLSATTFSDHAAFNPSEYPELAYMLETETTVDLDDPGGARSHLRLTLHWRDEQSEQLIEGPFALELVVTGAFGGVDASKDRESIRKWLDFNTQFLLWPYARGYIAQLTSASRHPALTIFTLQLPRPRAFEPETGEWESAEPAEG